MANATDTLRAFAQEVEKEIEPRLKRRGWGQKKLWEQRLLSRAKTILADLDKPKVPKPEDPAQLRLPGV
jgi:hypothetical protein